jgi:hypothetical protein
VAHKTKSIEQVKEAFERHYIPEPNSGCWLWTSAIIDKHGYGAFTCRSWGFKATRAPRVSYTIHCHPVPEGKHVLHRCDTPACVNPGHLFLGSHQDNVRDMVHKKRHTLGTRNRHAKLTEGQARAILASVGEPLKSVATRFGVSVTTVSEIRNRRHWTHL